jgi:hypothetical protein
MSGRIAVGCVGAPKLESAWSTVAVAGVYASIIGTAEVLAAFVSPVAAAAIHSVVLVALLTHYLVRPERVFAALALVPLLRLSSLALATEHPLAFYVLAGVPVLLGAVLAADALDLPGALRLWEIRHRSQWHAAVSAFAVAGVASSP